MESRLGKPRAAFGATTYHGRIWLCGGLERDDSGEGYITVNEVECYDPMKDL